MALRTDRGPVQVRGIESTDSPTAPGTADITSGPEPVLPTRSVTQQQAAAPASSPRSQPDQPNVGVPRLLQNWDRYEVIEALGSGGMGAVYKARDPRLKRAIALKIVHPRLGQGPGSTGEVFVRRFIREARLQASLDHPHICKIPAPWRNSLARAQIYVEMIPFLIPGARGRAANPAYRYFWIWPKISSRSTRSVM